MSNATSKFAPVAPARIGGVSTGRHMLTVQAEQLASITGRVGRRLHHWLKQTSAAQTVPDGDFLEAYRYYQAALLGLLKEQRERARMAGGEPISDEQYERELIELGRESIRAISDDEWRAEGVRRGLLPAPAVPDET